MVNSLRLQASKPLTFVAFLWHAGEDFDQRVMEYFIKLIKKKYKKDITGDARALQKLRREAERAKRALSSQHQVGRFKSHSVCKCPASLGASTPCLLCVCEINLPRTCRCALAMALPSPACNVWVVCFTVPARSINMLAYHSLASLLP